MFRLCSKALPCLLSFSFIFGCGVKKASESTDTSEPAAAANSSTTSSAESSKPRVVSMLPASGAGMSQKFAVTVSDSAGLDQIKAVYVIINDSAKDGCWFQYFRAENFLTMLNDANPPVWVSSTIGSGMPLSNRFCDLNPADASVLKDGSQLTLTVPVTFKPALSGSRNLFVLADGFGNRRTEWEKVGTWTVK
jgi:hypothetical protein